MTGDKTGQGRSGLGSTTGGIGNSRAITGTIEGTIAGTLQPRPARRSPARTCHARRERWEQQESLPASALEAGGGLNGFDPDRTDDRPPEARGGDALGGPGVNAVHG